MMHLLYKHRHVCEGHALSRHLASSISTPEVVVAFVFDKLGSEEFSRLSGAYDASHSGSLDQLKKSLQTSTSSIVAEYFYPDGHRVMSDALIQLTSSGARRAKVISVRPSSSSVDAIINNLRDESSIFSNGVADLILVQFENADNMIGKDALIQQILSFVAENSKGNFVSILTANAASANVQLEFPSGERHARVFSMPSLLSVSATSSNSSSNSTYTGPQYITSTILLGLLISGFLLFVLFIGINVVTSVESPVRFPRKNFVVKKEY